MAVYGATHGRVVTDMWDIIAFMVYTITVIVILAGCLYGTKRD